MIFKNYLTFLLLILISFLSGCEIVGGIFEAGVWFGILIVVLVVAVLIWVLRKFVG